MILQRTVPLRLKKSEHAADIFRGTWPTTMLLRTTATAYGSLCVRWLAPAVQLFSSRWAPNTLVDVVASNTSLDLTRLHLNIHTIFSLAPVPASCMLGSTAGRLAGQLTIHYVIVKIIIAQCACAGKFVVSPNLKFANMFW